MDVAIRGDLASCLTLRLAPSTWAFAIARGFGEIDDVPIARSALARFEAECRKRTRSEARRRRLLRSHTAAGVLCGAIARVNGALYLRSAGHDDYVPSACSLSAALVVRNRAYVAHAGSTAVYLVHRGDVLPLTGDDAFDDGTLAPVLARALGVEPSLSLAVSSIALEHGDLLAFCGHPMRQYADSQRFVELLENGPEPHVMRVRYEAADDLWMMPERPRIGLWRRLLTLVRRRRY
jgi:hypothetical protein